MSLWQLWVRILLAHMGTIRCVVLIIKNQWTITLQQSIFLGLPLQHREKNRYKDVVCYDDTRVYNAEAYSRSPGIYEIHCVEKRVTLVKSVCEGLSYHAGLHMLQGSDYIHANFVLPYNNSTPSSLRKVRTDYGSTEWFWSPPPLHHPIFLHPASLLVCAFPSPLSLSPLQNLSPYRSNKRDCSRLLVIAVGEWSIVVFMTTKCVACWVNTSVPSTGQMMGQVIWWHQFPGSQDLEGWGYEVQTLQVKSKVGLGRIKWYRYM